MKLNKLSFSWLEERTATDREHKPYPHILACFNTEEKVRIKLANQEEYTETCIKRIFTLNLN